MRATCRAAFAAPTPPKGGVTVDLAACRALGASLAADAQARRAVRRAPSQSRESPLSLPVRFATLEDEVNLLALYHLLDFGSGYDAEMVRVRSPGRPQRECLAFGVLGLHLSGRPLDAEWMAGFSLMEVQTVFGIEATIDVPLKPDLPGVTVSKPGPLAPLASAIRRALNETGAMLVERAKEAAVAGGGGADAAREAAKAKSLGALVLALLAEGNGLMGGGAGGGGGSGGDKQQQQPKQPKQQRLTSADFARELVEAVPAFDDWGLLLLPEDGKAERLCFWRRAQNLAADLARLADRRQREEEQQQEGGGDGQQQQQQPPPPLPAELAFADGDARDLSADACPGVAAALRARALLKFSPALTAAVDAAADLSSGGGAMQPSERAVRAACVAAVDAIVEGAAGGGAGAMAAAPPFTAREVGAWLGGQATAAEERAAERQRGRGGGGGSEAEGGEVNDDEPSPLLLKKYVYRETTAY
jgi:hypothetical protein